MWKNVHPVNKHRDSNPWPLEYEYSPITTDQSSRPYLNVCIQSLVRVTKTDFFNIGNTRPLFCLFLGFEPDPQDGRCRQIHWAMEVPNKIVLWVDMKRHIIMGGKFRTIVTDKRDLLNLMFMSIAMGCLEHHHSKQYWPPVNRVYQYF